MKEKESHPVRNGIITTVVGGILLTFWAPFRDMLLNILSWLWGLVIGGWSYISTEHSLYGWVVIILTLLSLPTVVSIISKLKSKTEPGYQDLYTEDYLFGAKWHWNYNGNSITDLWCLCPQCEGELVYSEFIPDSYNFRHDGMQPKTDFICEKCQASRASIPGRKNNALGTVEREIRRKIRTNEWKNN